MRSVTNYDSQKSHGTSEHCKMGLGLGLGIRIRLGQD